MSILNQQRGAGERYRYRTTFWLHIGLTLLLVGGGAASILFAAPFLLRLYGPSFADAHQTVVVLMLAAVIEGLTIALAQGTLNQERLWITFWIMSVPCYSVIAGAAYFLTAKGAIGLAWSCVLGWSLCLATTIVLLCVFGIGDPPEAARA